MKRGNPSSDDEDQVPERAAFCFGGGAQTPACLLRELHQMPSTSQQCAAHDVLGITESLDVPPESLAELFEEIKQLEHKPAWDLAMEMDPDYTTSPRLGMAFLRSVEGRPKQAAKRLTRHFQTKLDLFGIDKLVKDIELSDFDEDDMEALYSGGFQVLPAKDRAGRPILFGRYTLMKYREAKNMVSTGCDQPL
jgi:hypothetical protein